MTSEVKPYFQTDRVTIYHGDALAVLRQLASASADLILTDPPYCAGGMTEAEKTAAKSQGVLRGRDLKSPQRDWFAADNMTTGGLVWLLRAALLQGRRILKPNRAALVFADWRMVPHLAPALESSGLRYRNMLVWDKGSAGLGRGFKPRHEIVLEYTNGSTEYPVLNGSNVLRCGRVHASRRRHPTQKPVDLLQELIRVTATPGGTVVDPFMGSGSTIVAALASGMNVVGSELDEQHCETAARRAERLLAGDMSEVPEVRAS